MDDYQAIPANNGLECTDRQRRRLVMNLDLNGIDYVEIDPWNIHNAQGVEDSHEDARPSRLHLVLIHCFKSLPEEMKEGNIQIVQKMGIVPSGDIVILWARRADKLDNAIISTMDEDASAFFGRLEKKDKILVVSVDLKSVNRDDYFLKLTDFMVDRTATTVTVGKFDSLLSIIRLPLEVFCKVYDCAHEPMCTNDSTIETSPEPLLDYMAKDYESFLGLIKNRLRQILPNWEDKSQADIEIMLLELVAYLGDHMSYFQDAVATEAYLGTARNRISIRRHGRLLDYYLHEGCNSRTWVHVGASKELRFPRKTVLFTDPAAPPTPASSRRIFTDSALVSENDFHEIKDNAIVFETMYDETFYSQNNSYSFYSWGESRCFIQRGSSEAYLKIDEDSQFFNFRWQNIPGDENEVLRLLGFLQTRFKIPWLSRSKVEKDEDEEGSKIKIYLDEPGVRNSNGSWEVLITLQDVSGNESSNNLHKRSRAAFLKLATGETVDLKTRLMVKDNAEDVEIQIPTLRPGDALAFEMAESSSNLNTTSISKTQCHVVRLTDVHLKMDPATGVWYYEISFDNDPLPFTICFEKDGERETSWAIGNLVLADHGYTVVLPEPLNMIPVGFNRETRWLVDDLENKDLTYSAPLFDSTYNKNGNSDHSYMPAMSMLQGDPRNALPEMYLIQNKDQSEGSSYEESKETWVPQKDLLNSNEFARTFVVEREQNGRTFLRFFGSHISSNYSKFDDSCLCLGDSYYLSGHPSTIDTQIGKGFNIRYRIGNGTRGNIGSHAIKHVMVRNVVNNNTPTEDEENINHNLSSELGNNMQSVIQIYNPIPAAGGTDPEDLSISREYIPWAFMNQQRAVTVEDYEKALVELPEIQKALAEIRWTGSWYTIFIAIDPVSGIRFNDELKSKVIDYLERIRLTGYDTEIVEPVYVPIYIEMNVCIKPYYSRSNMLSIIKQVFSNKIAPNGDLAFFHRDRWSVGDSLFLSNIYDAALNIEGVSSIDVVLFKKLGKPDNIELNDGYIKIRDHEIIVLDNDASKPENGIMVINVL